MLTRTFSWIRWIVILGLLLTAMGVMPTPVSQAQCRPRNEWATYVVVRGDTLSRIARRFGTTVAALTSGNCLTNANYIYVGQRLRVPKGGGGGDPAPVPGPAARDQIVPATYQAYQSGFLVWRADTGEVWAFVGVYQSGGTGTFSTYTSSQYAQLPMLALTPPPGFIAPIMGFNRVWSNLGDLKRRLGWAVNTELSYTPWVRTVGGVPVSFTLPSGLVAMNSGNGWMVTGTGPRDPFPPTPVEPVTRIVNFTAPPGPVQVGDTLTVTWKLEGTQYALLTIWDGETNVPVRSWDSLPVEGTVTMTVPTMLTSELRLVLQAANLTSTTPTKQWDTKASASLSIPVLDRAVTVTAQAAYQAYATGFMIWRQDNGTIYVFGQGMSTYPQYSYQSLPDNVCTDLAPGMICPINGFGRIWGSDTYVRRIVGWPTAQEQSFQVTIVTRGGIPLSMTLPDGRTVVIENGWNYHF